MPSGQYAPSRARLNGFFSLLAKKIGISCVLIKKKEPYTSQILLKF